MGAYGVTRRINIMASLPYVQTRASAGVLAGQSGSQDLSVGIKFNALSTPLTAAGTLHVIGMLSATVPTTDYTPDFYPMSIGSHSRRATARGILSFQSHRGLYMNGSASYTRRGNVTVDFTRIDGGVQYQLPMLRVGAPASALPDSLLADEGRSRAGAIHVEGLTREQLAIAQKWNDGAGTYTPPGHWNDIAAELIRDARYSEVRAARAFALLNMSMHDASVACWEAKYTYFNPRPSHLRGPGLTGRLEKI